MAGVLELVYVGPYFSLPSLVVDSRLAAASTPSMKPARRLRVRLASLQFDKDAADLLDIVAVADEVFVAKQVAEAEFAGLALGLRTGMKWAVFSPQLFSRVAGHPKSLFVSHPVFAPGECAKYQVATDAETRFPRQ